MYLCSVYISVEGMRMNTSQSFLSVDFMSLNGSIIKKKKTSRVNNGRATNDLIHSAYVDTNDNIFPLILNLYVPEKSKIADITYGKGVFWKQVQLEKYDPYFSDIKQSDLQKNVRGGVNSIDLPYEDCFFDAIVFDPPYMHTPGGTAHNGHQNFETYYANNKEEHILRLKHSHQPKYHEAVLDLYFKTGKEAWRVLKENGIFIVKCQDEVCANKQRLTHIEITNEYHEYGFLVEDLFVVVQNGKPGVSRLLTKQYHARKNHSYFMVYRKPKNKKKKN